MNDKTDVATTEQNNIIPVVDGKPNLLAYAISQGSSIETIEKMMDLQERNDKYEAEKQFTEAMNQFRAKCPSIEKTKSGHNCKYAGLAETIDTIKQTEADCGLSHRWTTGKDADGLVLVTCIVSHVGGHAESTTLSGEPDTTGSKNSAQAIGSIVAYLQRYTLFATLGIAAGDEDTDGHTVNLAALQDAIRKHFDTIVAVKHGIRDNDLYSAGEAWFELSQDEQKSLWVAPTKGGIFTTEERRIMKEELRKAYYESGDKK